MKNSLIVFLLFVLMLSSFPPIVKADGMPYPPIRPQIKEEHQIAFVELKNKELITTLDLGIRNKPKNIFSVLENPIYISSSNPFWIKTFILPTDFSVKDLCINSYDFGYYWSETSPVKITINGNTVYLYTPMQCTNHAQCSKACSKLCPSNVYGCCVNGNLGQCDTRTGQCFCSVNSSFCKSCPTCDYTYQYCDGFSKTCKRSYEIISTEEISVPPRPIAEKQTYCQFMKNEKISDPQFVDISSYFKPGQYNTIEIRSNVEYRSFSIQKIYLTSGIVTDKVKIIIPFKIMPKSVEIGGTGLDIYSLDYPFREKREWYGYYGGSLFSASEAPELAMRAQTVEQGTKYQIAQTQVATDATGSFQGKVSDLVGQVSAAGISEEQEGKVIRFAARSEIETLYQAYMQDTAYVIELSIQPYELKRITIKWVEDVTDENYFPYYYPLGTGKTWSENISYTAVYVKLPKPYAIDYANLEGKEVASDDNYNYYRWKFVDSNPDQDLHINVKKLSPVEQTLLEISIWMRKNSGVVAIAIVLAVMGVMIYKYCKYYEEVRKKGKKRF